MRADLEQFRFSPDHETFVENLMTKKRNWTEITRDWSQPLKDEIRAISEMNDLDREEYAQTEFVVCEMLAPFLEFDISPGMRAGIMAKTVEHFTLSVYASASSEKLAEIVSSFRD